MERSTHFLWENLLFLWSFSIAMLNYQRVFGRLTFPWVQKATHRRFCGPTSENKLGFFSDDFETSLHDPFSLLRGLFFQKREVMEIHHFQ